MALTQLALGCGDSGCTSFHSLDGRRVNVVIEHVFFGLFSLRGNGEEWRPCLVDVTHKHCDVVEPPFWQTIHTLRVTETNALGSETTHARFKLYELCKTT